MCACAACPPASRTADGLLLLEPAEPLFATIIRPSSVLIGADDVRYNGALPNVSLLGPFTYVEQRVKHNITWTNDGEDIQFLYNRTFVYYDTPCPPNTPTESQAGCLVVVGCRHAGRFCAATLRTRS